MLIGQYQTKINQKGRVALPAKFKRVLGKKIIVTAGYEQSLMIVTQKDWQVAVDRINQGSTLGPTRETDRFLLGSAHDVQLDSQGRFVIPKHLREYADLNLDIVFVGVGNRAEIWNQVSWEAYSHNLNKKVKKLGEKLDQVKS
ncbi:MAG: division/cell wall cluster transcriptional repressor MraZ [Candidatus Beckwithbacteria bacterium]|nr:division/cell wall cluster transcriptional repressor MraZ [Patescibacteria group bacterium]